MPEMFSKPATVLSWEELATLFHDGFKGYVGGDVHFTAEQLEKYVPRNHYSLSRSHIFFSPEHGGSDKPIGFGFIAVRSDKPETTRLAMMGIVPEARGGGTGTQCLQLVMEGERAHGVKVLELETIKQNEVGFKLYSRAGFKVVRELLGWERDGVVPGEFLQDSDLTTCPVSEVDALVRGDPAANELAWQAWQFAGHPNATHGFRLGGARCVVSDPENNEEDTVTVYSFITEPGRRAKGDATRLAQAMLAKFPTKKWDVPAIYAKEYGDGIAKRLGFRHQELTQYQMRANLQGGA